MDLFYEAEMNSVTLQVLVEDMNEMNAKIQWDICGLFLKRNFSQKSYAKTMSVKMEGKNVCEVEYLSFKCKWGKICKK